MRSAAQSHPIADGDSDANTDTSGNAYIPPSSAHTNSPACSEPSAHGAPADGATSTNAHPQPDRYPCTFAHSHARADVHADPDSRAYPHVYTYAHAHPYRLLCVA